MIDFDDPARPATRKRRGQERAPDCLAAHLRRWRRDGHQSVIHWRGRAVEEIDTAFAAAVRRAETVLKRREPAASLAGVTPHVLKHTAVAWFFGAGGSMPDATSFFATTAQTLEHVYRKYSPQYQSRAAAIAGRGGRAPPRLAAEFAHGFPHGCRKAP